MSRIYRILLFAVLLLGGLPQSEHEVVHPDYFSQYDKLWKKVIDVPDEPADHAKIAAFIPDQDNPDDAARINQRYHERLAAMFPHIPEAPFADIEVDFKPILSFAYNTFLNSSSLSSCYDYIFRLSPF